MNKLFSIIALALAATLPGGIAAEEKSTCYGTTGNGYLKNGVQLPNSGKNYVGYSTTAKLLGRTYVHTTVRDILVDSYKALETTAPGKVFKYAETGFRKGGLFKPHKTHQNGLSVDFMVPVVDPKGRSVHLPTHAFNRFGYDIEFDAKGNYKDYRIDFDALGAHIVSLHKASLDHDVDIWRVILDPQLQPMLMATKHGEYLKKHVEFSKRRSWVRHDEHYHIDFDVPCEK